MVNKNGENNSLLNLSTVISLFALVISFWSYLDSKSDQLSARRLNYSEIVKLSDQAYRLMGQKTYSVDPDSFSSEEEILKAIDLIKECLIRVPEAVVCRIALGSAYWGTKSYYLAEKTYKEAIAMSTSGVHPSASLALAQLYDFQKRYADEKEVLLDAIELTPDDEVVFYKLGMLYQYRLDNYVEAEIWYKKAVAIDPDYKKAAMRLGMVLMMQRKYDEYSKLMNSNGNFEYYFDYIDELVDEVSTENK